jgi:hypothetical protein
MAKSTGSGYSKLKSSDGTERTTTGVFSSGWESFKRDWESIRLEWEPVEWELKTMDRQNRERFLERAKEASARLKALIDSRL